MIELIELWQKKARPNPDADAFRIAFAVHMEEFVEMMEVVGIADENLKLDPSYVAMMYWLCKVCDQLKEKKLNVVITNREKFLDSIADQIVTAVGAGYCANMKVSEAVTAVNASNYSKMVDGAFQYDENGKVIKPPTYKKANLEGLY